MSRAYKFRGGKISVGQCEVNVVEHCNLSCRSCSHLSPTLDRRSVDPATVERDLRVLSRHYHADTLRLLGGEPLLHRDLPGICAAVRASRIADRICLVTNGLLLPRMPDGLWRALDDVLVSTYPGRGLSTEDRIRCEQRAHRFKTTLAFSPFEKFRETYSEQGTESSDLRQRIFDSCRMAHGWRCHTVADGRFYKCPQSYFLPKVVNHCQPNQVIDSVALDDREDLGQRLLAYLESPEPLATCGVCLGSAGKRFEHTQIRRVEFRNPHQARPEELLDEAELAVVPVPQDRRRSRRILRTTRRRLRMHA